jgi:hypothetical protein
LPGQLKGREPFLLDRSPDPGRLLFGRSPPGIGIHLGLPQDHVISVTGREAVGPAGEVRRRIGRSPRVDQRLENLPLGDRGEGAAPAAGLEGPDLHDHRHRAPNRQDLEEQIVGQVNLDGPGRLDLMNVPGPGDMDRFNGPYTRLI